MWISLVLGTLIKRIENCRRCSKNISRMQWHISRHPSRCSKMGRLRQDSVRWFDLISQLILYWNETWCVCTRIMNIHISLSSYSRVVFIFPNPKCKHNQVEKCVILSFVMYLLDPDHNDAYIYVCWNGWKKNKYHFIVVQMIRKDVLKDLKDVNWLKLKMRERCHRSWFGGSQNWIR